MIIKTEEKNKNLIVRLTGEIDHHSAKIIKTEIEAMYTKKDIKHLILDFSNVSFMDSSGIGMVIGRYKQAATKNGKLSIIGMNRDLIRIYEISGLSKIINCYKSLDDAMKYV